MDENTWRIVQMGMWIIGIQTAVILAAMGALHASMTKKVENLDAEIKSANKAIGEKIDKLDVKLQDVDKRVFAIETLLHMKDFLMLKGREPDKKAE